MTLKYGTAIAITILATAAAIPSAFAQQYPTKPIRMLIPSPPGGGTDVLGRIIGDGLTKLWVRQVVVDDRGGASGRIAADVVAKSTPDG